MTVFQLCFVLSAYRQRYRIITSVVDGPPFPLLTRRQDGTVAEREGNARVSL